MSTPQYPNPEEIQKRLQEFLKQTLGSDTASGAAAQPEATDDAPVEVKEDPKRFDFPYTPKQIKAHLDRFVIRQDEAKKVLSIAVCDHYNSVKRAETSEQALPYTKQNVLMLGPTGVGKTYLVKCLAELVGVPMVKADATKFTETGYVGGDVEDLVRDLVQEANGDVKLAQYGIIYIDEIDKLASSGTHGGRDVSGRGVQTNLLKLMEDTDVSVRNQNDIQAQLQAAMNFQRGGGGAPAKDAINTRYILFIVSGAFDKLDGIVRRRVTQTEIGFGSRSESSKADKANILQQAATADFIEYGMEPEFIGRLPVRVACAHLAASDLFDIMKFSEGSLIRQYEASFQDYGIDALFADDGLHAISEAAAQEETGARALATVCERVLRDFKFELPDSGVRQLVINKALVTDPPTELERIQSDDSYEKRQAMAEMVTAFSERFERAHGLKLSFTPGAVNLLVDGALETDSGMLDHCGVVFKDFEFGLKLVAQNAGDKTFTLGEDVVRNPQDVLSSWVVASYPAGKAPEAEEKSQ